MYEGKVIAISCNECGTFYYGSTAKRTLAGVRKQARDDGWHYHKKIYLDLCRDCAESMSKKVEKRK